MPRDKISGIMATQPFLAVMFFGFTTAYAAEFALEMDPHSLARPLSEFDQARVALFLSEVQSRLPSQMKKTLARTIRLRFSPMNAPNGPLVPPPCNAEEKKRLMNQGSSARRQIYGQLAAKTDPQTPDVIELNEVFLDEIRKGPQNSRTFPCGQKSLYALAQGTLEHELMHLYDEDQGRRNGSSLSTDAQFLHLTHWEKGGFMGLGGTGQKNKEGARSPDPAEFVSASESLAINFEYFMTDP